MKGRWGWLLVTANLLVLVGLAFVFPQFMVSPGALMPAHASLAADCFACHTPWHGAAPERCVMCHVLPDIGLRTTKGVPVARPTPTIAFHQELDKQDCIACHSDHQRPKLTHRSRISFSHGLLREATQQRCAACHTAPKNNIHLDLAVSCGKCHQPEGWKPATFDHAFLTAARRDQCEGCHKPPTDSLHRQSSGQCNQCHSAQRWKPATFEHDKLFQLDRDHSPSCETCHTGDDYSRYTCYGCHEHTVANVRGKHIEEGIQNFENCVKCHRSANDEPKGRGGRESKGDRKHGKHD